jgi:hypothetical protein
MSPTVLQVGPFRFHFYSDERNEPPHIHVSTSDGECKFWLQPIKLASTINIPPHVLRKIEKIVYDNVETLTQKFYEFHRS